MIFNKRGVVVAADSAVTTSNGDSDKRARYAKTANKIFELCDGGGVAVAIFGGASIDLVPWELAIKQFRKSIRGRRLPHVGNYVDELLAFLKANAQLFPSEVLVQLEANHFESATVEVLKFAKALSPSLVDQDALLDERKAAWDKAYAAIQPVLVNAGVKAPLTSIGLDAALSQIQERWVPLLTKNMSGAPDLLDSIDVDQLAELAHRWRFTQPDELNSYTGVVVLGYLWPGRCTRR
ncbi:hypothetical protein [Paucibacter sp. B2R-40]|uniref:hypothetical protein n=1 Tax=Paucibacter sp. B2R-40 TaxID=2893554 RepID=UPI0021E4A6B9|nr:hypothetical protein [Paucibacter sp. B2R-40]